MFFKIVRPLQSRFLTRFGQIFTFDCVDVLVIIFVTVFTDEPIKLCKWEQLLWLAELLVSEGQVEAEWVEGQMQQLAAFARPCPRASFILSVEGEAWWFCWRFLTKDSSVNY